MVHNDFLRPLLMLHPLVVGFVIWIFGWGSLFIAAIKMGTVQELFRHPGFMFGDFVLLPLSASLITYFYQSIRQPSQLVTSPVWMYVTISLSLGLAIRSALNFTSISVWWLPHLVFYLFMYYIILMFLTKGLIQLIIGVENNGLWLIWSYVLITVLLHLLLGISFGPKKITAI